VTVVVEGPTDLPVLSRVLEFVDCSIDVAHGQRGKASIDRNIRGYNNAARFSPWIVMRDLDHDAACAPELAAAILPWPSQWMRLRIAVRALESWLLADAEALSNYLHIRRAHVPNNPEALDDPKRSLVDLARRSRRAAIRDDMVPAEGVTSRVGPAYPSRVAEFARTQWRPGVAREHSESLRSCIESVRLLKHAFENH
jgi:hypothetical protein